MDDSELARRLQLARGNAVPGGRISSLGASGGPRMIHSSQDGAFKSDGRPSWVGKPNLKKLP